jgi:hypothetical protein
MSGGMARARQSAAGTMAAAALFFSLCGAAGAYTAAGDRLFPATLVLPQIAPGDEFYVNAMTLPLAGGTAGAASRATSFTTTYAKTITDRLGIVIDESWTRLDRVGAGSFNGWQNFDTAIKYLAIVDQPHEFLFTVGLGREFGGTGASRVGARASGATTPTVFFGKGLGDLDIGLLRPLAITGEAGYQIADTRPRPDLVTTGFVVEYSIPYLESKVQSFDLPELVRGLTPMTEVSITVPSGQSFGARTTALIAPGVSYAGEGWELAIEGLVPASRATGKGIGVTAQFHLSLDFVAPETIGRPLFSAP